MKIHHFTCNSNNWLCYFLFIKYIKIFLLTSQGNPLTLGYIKTPFHSHNYHLYLLSLHRYSEKISFSIK